MNFKKKKKKRKASRPVRRVFDRNWKQRILRNANLSFGMRIYIVSVFSSLLYIFFFYPRLLSIAIQHFRAVPNGFARLLQEMRKASADNNYIVIECIIIVNVFKLYSKWIVRVNLSRRNRFIFNGIEGGKATCYVNRIKLKSLSCCKNNENLLCGYEEVFR